MEAQELARAKLSAQQTKRQKAARRNRERRLTGSRAARQALAQDFSAVSEAERHRAAKGEG